MDLDYQRRCSQKSSLCRQLSTTNNNDSIITFYILENLLIRKLMIRESEYVHSRNGRVECGSKEERL